MPCAGYTNRRDNIINKKLHKNFVKEQGIDVSYEDFRKIIEESCAEIFNIIANEPEGFKLPESMGYIVVTRYKSEKKAIDWLNTKKYNKRIHIPNLHSFGYIHHIKWYTFVVARFKFALIYKYQPARFLKRALAKNVIEGKQYFTWKNSDFLRTSKLDRMYHKRYKKDTPET